MLQHESRHLTHRPWLRGLGTAVAVVLGLAAVPAASRAQNMEVPVSIQLPLFLKVMTFDRNLEKRAGKKLVLAVAYQKAHRASARARDEAVRALAGVTQVGPFALEVISIDLDKEHLATALDDHRVSFLYVTPLRAIDLGDVVTAARAAGVSTVTGVPGYVVDGLSVGVRLQADRPKLIINLEAAKLEGSDFTAELLKLVQLIP